MKRLSITLTGSVLSGPNDQEASFAAKRCLCACFTGGPLSRDDLIQLEGVVTRVLGGGTMEIECENQVMVRGVLSGRMKKHRIKVIKGDRVQVSVSPYDTSHGIITFRYS